VVVAAPPSRDVKGIRERPSWRIQRKVASCYLKRAVEEALEPASDCWRIDREHVRHIFSNKEEKRVEGERIVRGHVE